MSKYAIYLDPVLQPLLRAIKSYIPESIFSAFDEEHLDFTCDEKFGEFFSNIENSSWLIEYIFSSYPRTYNFFNSASENNINLVVDWISDNLHKNFSDDLNDFWIKLGFYCYILIIIKPNNPVASQKLSIALQLYINILIDKHVELSDILTPALSLIEDENYFNYLFASIHLSWVQRFSEFCDFCDKYLIYSDEEQVLKFLEANKDFAIAYFSNKPRRITNFLEVASKDSICKLLDITTRFIQQTEAVMSINELEMLCLAAILCFRIVESRKAILKNSAAIEATIFSLLKIHLPKEQFSVAMHDECQNLILSIEHMIIGLIEELLEIFSLTTANFKDEHLLNILFYIDRRNSGDFVESLLNKGISLDAIGSHDANALFWLLSKTNFMFVPQIQKVLQSYQDGGVKIIADALVSSFALMENRKECGLEDDYLSSLAPCLISMLFKANPNYENLQLKFDERCLWDVETFKNEPHEILFAESLLLNMLKSTGHSVEDIMTAISDQQSSTQMGLIQGLLKTTWDISNSSINLQVWQYLSRNANLCNKLLNQFELVELSKNSQQFYTILSTSPNSNPLEIAVAIKNHNFLLFIFHAFKRSNNTPIAFLIADAAKRMINSDADIELFANLKAPRLLFFGNFLIFSNKSVKFETIVKEAINERGHEVTAMPGCLQRTATKIGAKFST